MHFLQQYSLPIIWGKNNFHYQSLSITYKTQVLQQRYIKNSKIHLGDKSNIPHNTNTIQNSTWFQQMSLSYDYEIEKYKLFTMPCLNTVHIFWVINILHKSVIYGYFTNTVKTAQWNLEKTEICVSQEGSVMLLIFIVDIYVH